MPYYVYILQSLKDQSFYKGYSVDPDQRLIQHNNGESEYTSHKRPWILVYKEECASKMQVKEMHLSEKEILKRLTEKELTH